MNILLKAKFKNAGQTTYTDKKLYLSLQSNSQKIEPNCIDNSQTLLNKNFTVCPRQSTHPEYFMFVNHI